MKTAFKPLTFLASVTIALVGVALGTTAQAAMISYSDSIDFTDFKNTNFTDILSVPQFDSSLGTLNKVTVTVTGSAQGTYTLKHTETGSIRYGETVGFLLRIEDPSSFFIENSLEKSIKSGTLNRGNRSLEVTLNLEAIESYLASDINPYIGTGKIDFNVTVTSLIDITKNGNDVGFKETFPAGNAELTVEYEYTETSVEIPEPTTLFGLFVVSGVGLISCRRQFWL